MNNRKTRNIKKQENVNKEKSKVVAEKPEQFVKSEDGTNQNVPESVFPGPVVEMEENKCDMEHDDLYSVKNLEDVENEGVESTQCSEQKNALVLSVGEDYVLDVGRLMLNEEELGQLLENKVFKNVLFQEENLKGDITQKSIKKIEKFLKKIQRKMSKIDLGDEYGRWWAVIKHIETNGSVADYIEDELLSKVEEDFPNIKVNKDVLKNVKDLIKKDIFDRTGLKSKVKLSVQNIFTSVDFKNKSKKKVLCKYKGFKIFTVKIKLVE